MARHWRGELPLSNSFWTNIVVLNLAWMVVTLWATSLAQGGRATGDIGYGTAVLVTAIAGLQVPMIVWQVVGTWRSGSRHVARGGRGTVAIAVKTVLLLGLLVQIALSFFVTHPTIDFAWRRAAMLARLPPAEFVLLDGGQAIEFRGGVRAGTAEELRRILHQQPGVRTLLLESPGGDLRESQAMADIVLHRRLDTQVRDACVSTRTTIFRSGRNRWLAESGRLGFHMPAGLPAGMAGTVQVSAERRMLLYAGVPEWFLARAYAAPAHAPWFPTVEELQRATFITAVADGLTTAVRDPTIPTTTLPAGSAERARQAATDPSIPATATHTEQKPATTGAAADARDQPE